MANPTCTLIGHCCLDITPSGYQLGGSAAYINAILNTLDISPSLITGWNPPFQYESTIKKPGTKVILQQSSTTTIFENIYENGIRKQYLREKAEKIVWNSQYSSMDCDILFLCPIADEVDFTFIKNMNANLKVATIQGWLRQRTSEDLIICKVIDAKKLAGLDIIILSNEDLPDYKNYISWYLNYVKIIIVTLGENGALLYTPEQKTWFPPCPSEPIDLTGAGDAFACGLTLEYYSTKNLQKAIIKANATASVVIENQGIHLPSHADIQHKIDTYPQELIKEIGT